MKKIIVALTVLGLLLVPLYAVQAQNTVEISLHGAETVVVQESDYIVLRAGWAACTKGFTKAWQNAVNFELELDGSPLLAPGEQDLYFGSIEPWIDPNPNPEYYCIAAPRGNTASVLYWKYPLGILDPDTYEIHFRASVDHRLADGGDWDNDGYMDFLEGTYADRTITLIVLSD